MAAGANTSGANTSGANTSGAFNWAAFGLAETGAELQLGSDLVKIGTMQLQFAATYVQAQGAIAQSIANQATYRSQAKSYRQAADDAMKAAGRAQEQGQQAREQRLVQLGQQKGRIVASASGSGIDVSSKVVDKVMKDTIKSAYNDTAVIAQNEKQAADQKINESYAMRINAERAEANAQIEGINQSLIAEQIKLQKRAARHAMIGGILSAAEGFVKGTTAAMTTGGGV